MRNIIYGTITLKISKTKKEILSAYKHIKCKYWGENEMAKEREVGGI